MLSNAANEFWKTLQQNKSQNYKSQGGGTYPKRSPCEVVVKNDHKLLQLSSHQEVWLIFPFTESGLCNYLHCILIRAWKWCFNFPFLGMLAFGTLPPCPYEEEPMALALWAPSWHVSEPSWKGILFPLVKPPRLTLHGTETSCSCWALPKLQICEQNFCCCFQPLVLEGFVMQQSIADTSSLFSHWCLYLLYTSPT